MTYYLRRNFGKACLFALAVLWLGTPVGVQAEETVIRFFHANDLDNMEPRRGLGGVGALATLIHKEQSGTSHHLITFGGDTISPSIMSSIDHGAHMVSLLNAVGVDVAVLGNHEFDFGPEVAQQRVAEATFPWLGSNVVDSSGAVAVGAQNRLVVERGGYKIGFFGILTADTKEISSPGNDIVFRDEGETGREAVAALKADGADVIVALTHQHLADDIKLADSVPGIDIILGGHDHAPLTHAAGGTLILKAGDNAKHLLVLDVALEQVERRGKTRLQMTPSWQFISSRGVVPHPDIQAKIDGYLAQMDENLGQPVGVTEIALDSRRAMVRTRETSFGSLIADALREGTGADVAITNGGGIRGDRQYDAGSTLTRRDIVSELPFGNVVVMLQAKGSDILAALENGFSQVENVAGRFPQVSGMSVTWDPNAAAGSRVSAVKIQGAPLDPHRIYQLATNDYMYSGGDGYAALKTLPPLINVADATLMATMVMDYIATKKKVSGLEEGRIVSSQ